MINIGDKVVVKDLSGLLKWSETEGIYAKYSHITGQEFTVEMNDLRIPMRRIIKRIPTRRIIKPHFDKVYMANLSLVNNEGERYFTCDRFVKKVPNSVTFLEAVNGMKQGHVYYNSDRDYYYKMSNRQIHSGFPSNFPCTDSNVVYDYCIVDYAISNEKVWQKVS